MAKQRKFFKPEEKVSILKEHLVDKKTISEICEAHCIQPILFYRWQKNMFDNAHAVFFHKNNVPRERVLERKINELEGKLAHKDTVIAEIMEDHLKLKKELGEL